ncbi:uncharacterized protein B0I36DRAFT_326731 [Microdochium trichocladiopsis]|uniref:Uncharacterized protein n=1 Tax=Microdochium trichocladiopsis TaxID=1682393 RepID=A0A9P8Y443_9PEZI|nr:uncharacterized protein B0I36DRAFT_326731 [Microdochium trichocladiopsis]KAH7027245.1 hypothetical protein B0I36DRAFT_326731 [Microdochium trichocladiopsis]
MPNVVERGTPIEIKDSDEHLVAGRGALSTTTQILPPNRPSFNQAALSDRRPYASQPVPSAYARPRIVTPIPPPVIPTSSTSSVYLSRPNVIEIESSVSSDSKEDSDVVVISKSEAIAPMQASPPPELPPLIPLEVKAAAPSPLSSPSPAPAQGQHMTQDNRELESRDDEPQEKHCDSPEHYNEPLLPPAASSFGQKEPQVATEPQPAQQSPEPTRKKAKRGKKRRRSSMFAEQAAPDVSVGVGVRLDRAMIMARKQFLSSLSRFHGQRAVSDQAVYRAEHHGLSKKAQKKRRRSSQQQEPLGGSFHLAGNTSSLARGEKRRHHDDADEGQDDGINGRITPAADTSYFCTRTMLADAAAQLASSHSPHKLKNKKRKLSHDDDDYDDASVQDDAKFSITRGNGLPPQSSSSATNNNNNIPSSSHPSLISPPTTSRPSSAGSRGV